MIDNDSFLKQLRLKLRLKLYDKSEVEKFINAVEKLLQKLELEIPSDLPVEGRIDEGIQKSYVLIINKEKKSLEVRIEYENKSLEVSKIYIKDNDKTILELNTRGNIKVLKPVAEFFLDKYNSVEEVIDNFIKSLKNKSFQDELGTGRNSLNFLPFVIQTEKSKGKYLDKETILENQTGVVYNKTKNEILVFNISDSEKLDNTTNLSSVIKKNVIKLESKNKSNFTQNAGSKYEVIKDLLVNFNISGENLKNVFNTMLQIKC